MSATEFGPGSSAHPMHGNGGPPLADAGDVTTALRNWRTTHTLEDGELFQLVYPQLRSIARSLFRHERQEHLLQPTGVVNELFLRLVTQHSLEFQDRQHFYSFAARVMRRVLVDHARAEGSRKRDGGQQVTLEPGTLWQEARPETVIDVERALCELDALDARKCRMLELRFVLGCTAEETAQIMEISKASVDREMRFVRGWLAERLQRQEHQQQQHQEPQQHQEQQRA